MVAGADNADATERLLRVAAVGLDPKRSYEVTASPFEVRRIGERWLDELKSVEAVAAFADATASGGLGERAAALLACGRRKELTYRPHIEAALGDEEFVVRAAAAEAVGGSGHHELVPALIKALTGEADERVAIAGLTSMFDVVEARRETVPEDVLRRSADVAIHSLGKWSWRTDLAAVKFLRYVRSAQSVPALIAVLERFVDEDTDEDKLSGMLRFRTHDTLVSLTGAVFPVEEPARWRDWWDKSKDEFVVAEVKDSGATENKTSTGDFFGIPVRGSRVLFIVDASGSMSWPKRLELRGTSSGAREMQKIEAAKSELLRAVEGLTVDCSFNLVWFGNGAKKWQKDMVRANPKMKKRFVKVVEDLRADGGTNLWEALSEGLLFKSLEYGDRYGTSYDELFILSDGLPSVGEITDPREIVRLLAESNRWSRLTINTIYISSGTEQEKEHARQVGMSGEEFMRKVAEMNGGKFVHL